jgi:hypothetical protein
MEGVRKRCGMIGEKERAALFKRSLRVFYRSVRSFSYVVPVAVHTVPAELIKDGLG